MSNPNTYMQQFFQAITQLNTVLGQLSWIDAQFANDPTIVTRYFTIANQSNGTNAQGQVPRSDINATDVNNALSGLASVFANWNSGGPPSVGGEITKMLP